MLNIKNKKFFICSFVLSTFLVIGFLALNSTVAQAENQNDCDRLCRRDLAAARAATAKYHDVNQAVADGFVPVSPCVEIPNVGAMGIHYINFSRADLNVDVSEPEYLLYMPDENGKLRLVGVEYFVPFTGSNPAPNLFGRDFQGPMPGHAPGEPAHYDLHVWICRINPDGMFAQFNPALSCP
jgi:hypothetical protein